MDDEPESTLTDEAPPRLRRSGRRWVQIVIAVTAALIPVVAAIIHAGTSGSLEPGAGASPTPPTPGTVYGWFAYADPNTKKGTAIGTPVDAVERAGLRLPEHASIDKVETQTYADAAETYLFVFHVDAAIAEAFCTQDGLEGPRPVSALPAAVAEQMDFPTITPGSRWCGGSAPTNPAWSRHFLIGPGDPATVHLSLQRS
ncbi:hypothetical protein [Terrabacter terrigena]|uniref:Uncharacterized protein n=1 Tax=Terrabacter terrigena TaxID=574718 RepID=A0ABW3MUY3_9MICO